MFRFFVVTSALVAMASAYGDDGYGGGMGGGHGGGYGGGHSVPAAVISKHHVNHYDVPSSGHITPTTIDVPPNMLPVNFVFHSASSHINVANKHKGTHGSFKETHSQDEPHKLVHHVTKPIIQEVHEIISPYRKITQTVEPVHEEIKTMVARHSGHHQGHGYEGGYGGGMGGKMSGGYGAGLDGGLKAGIGGGGYSETIKGY